MGRRSDTTLHDFWHPRVEGQILHTMGRHPNWFNFTPGSSQKKDCINSLAKRIVGEIVAATRARGDNAGPSGGTDCKDQLKGADETALSRRRGKRNKVVASPFQLHWYDAKKHSPKVGGHLPYLVIYKASSSRKESTTIAIWAGEKKGWIFMSPKFRKCLSENVIQWALYPEPPKEIK